METQPQVAELEALLENEKLRSALQQSLNEAAYPGITSIQEFYDFLDRLLTHIPEEKELMPSVREFYYVLSKSPGDLLRKDEIFNKWIQKFPERIF